MGNYEKQMRLLLSKYQFERLDRERFIGLFSAENERPDLIEIAKSDY